MKLRLGSNGDALEAELARIPSLDLPALKHLYLELTGAALPSFLRVPFARRAVAHALRERHLGGLDPDTRRQLEELVAQIEPLQQGPLRKPRRKPRAGTRLLREWQGKVHEVAVLADGFLWNGAQYRSLSKIAGEITGTRWNGWVFFGVKKPTPRRVAMPIAPLSPSSETVEAGHG